MNKKEKEWGVVQDLTVTADTYKALKSAITIALVEHEHAVAWKVEANVLSFGWSASEYGNKFLTEIGDPEKLADLVMDWLATTKPDAGYPDTDGSAKIGFTLSLGGYDDVCVIKPTYVVYGK